MYITSQVPLLVLLKNCFHCSCLFRFKRPKLEIMLTAQGQKLMSYPNFVSFFSETIKNKHA